MDKIAIKNIHVTILLLIILCPELQANQSPRHSHLASFTFPAFVGLLYMPYWIKFLSVSVPTKIFVEEINRH